MARLMSSCGMFSALAARIAVRRRALLSGLPPPLAATAISFSSRVKILPRLASSAPFLCLIVAHFEWPDITEPQIDSLNWCEQAPDLASITQEDRPIFECKASAADPANQAEPPFRLTVSAVEYGRFRAGAYSLPPGCCPALCFNSRMQMIMKQAITPDDE